MILQKLQKILFYFLLFLIPSNLGKHFILPSSYVSGILVDYLIPTVYLTDIIILLILFLEIPKLKNYRLRITVYGSLIFGYLLLNSLLASNKPAAFYKFFKLLELFLLSIYIKSNINIKKDIKKIAQVCAGSSIFQSLLALAQWTKDGSVFNNYLFFGEQPYSLSTPGIKKISFQGLIKAPPLGTFPHPNVLAGFLILSFPIILHLLPKKKLLFTVYSLLMTICLFLTFSFPAWLAFGIILLTLFFSWRRMSRHPVGSEVATEDSRTACGNPAFPQAGRMSLKSKKRKNLMPSAYMLVPILVISCWLLVIGYFPVSFSRRQTLNQIALKMFLKKPLTGVGLNNFTYVMENYGQVIGFTRFLQPVHNVYLLILSETGIIGFLIFLYLSLQIIRKAFKTKKITSFYFLLFTFYFLLFFDHYLFTTQQGLLLSILVFSLAA